MWTQWSDNIILDSLGALQVATCYQDSVTAVTLGYSASFAKGRGGLQSTVIVTFTPRWLLMNRTGLALVLRRTNSCESAVMGDGHTWPIETAARRGTNAIQLKYADSPDLPACEWSDEVVIDSIGDTTLNLRYVTSVASSANANGIIPVTALLPQNAGTSCGHSADSHTGTRSSFSVVRVAVYQRDCMLMVSVDAIKKPPLLVENRTEHVVEVRQRGVRREHLTVYPRTSKGFVWDMEAHAQIIHFRVLASSSSAAAAVTGETFTLNLSTAMLMTVKGRRALNQEAIVPAAHSGGRKGGEGGMRRVFLRVRAMEGRYAISLTCESHIDTILLQPFHQHGLKIELDSVNVLLKDHAEDIALLTVQRILLYAAQGREPSLGKDVQELDFRVGSIQLDDERVGALREVVFATASGRPSYARLVRVMDRSIPLVHVKTIDVSVRPMMVQIEDSFLFDVFRFVERATTTQSAVVAGGIRPSLSPSAAEGDSGATTTFDMSARYQDEISRKEDESSVLLRVAFIETLLIDHVTLAVSLLRGTDAKRDPIREKLGIVANLVRSVENARFDMRKVAASNVADKIWVLTTLLREHYTNEALRQVLNMVNVVGLDTFRGMVTDLLDGYFITSADKANEASALLSSQLTRRRAETQFAVDDSAALERMLQEEWQVLDHDLDASYSGGSAAPPNAASLSNASVVARSASSKSIFSTVLSRAGGRARPDMTFPMERIEPYLLFTFTDGGRVYSCNLVRDDAPGIKTASSGSHPTLAGSGGPLNTVLALTRARQRTSNSAKREKYLGQLVKANTFSQANLSVAELAKILTWEDFVATVPPSVLRSFGHIAIEAMVRKRGYDGEAAGDGGGSLQPPSLCTRCKEIEAQRRLLIQNDQMSPLPHPITRQITWEEFCHHVSWFEFVQLMTETEVVQWATAVKRNVMGRPQNVTRIRGEIAWCLEE